MKRYLIILMTAGLLAQDSEHHLERDFHDRDVDRHERMEMMMVWRLTEDLELTPDQAEKFFPRFRKHREELEEVKKMERVLGKEMKQKLKKDEDLSETEVRATVAKITELRKKHVDLESAFLLGMDDILSPRQLANLGMFKQKMMRDIRGELKERHRGKKGHHGKKKKWGNKRRRGF